MAKLHAIFDSLAYANKLKGVGVSEQQATVQAETLFSIIDDQILTKQDMEEIKKSISSMNYDIKDIETRLSHDIKDVETRLSEDNKKLDMKLSYEIQATKHEVITKLGSLMAVLLSLFGGSIGALIKLGH